MAYVVKLYGFISLDIYKNIYKMLGLISGFGFYSITSRYKLGYKTAPEVHHVYVSSPPASVKYVEYVDKPVFVERIIERPTPVFKPVHVEYRESSPYG